MRMLLAVLALSLGVPTPACAQDKSSMLALGYSPLFSLEQGGGAAPFGVSLSAATLSRGIGIEADLACHRDEGATILTAAVGPRLQRGGRSASPFAHLMVFLRHDSYMGFSSNHGGAMAGVGVDTGGHARPRLRLAVDVQILVAGEFFEFLRPTVGVVF